MKLKDINERILAGQVLLVGEYRMATVDNIKYRDKKTNAQTERGIIKTTIETANRTVVVSAFGDPMANPAAYRSPFTKGQKVVVSLTSLNEQRGNVSASGAIELLEG